MRLGQVAAFADRHFFVKKEIKYERIDEIARMLGGGKAAIEHAREMVGIR